LDWGISVADDKKPRIAATTLSEADCISIIEELHAGRGEVGTQGRWAELHAEIAVRDQHYHADPRVSPKFAAPFEHAQTYQTDTLRRVHQNVLTRMTEHPYVIECAPANPVSKRIRDAEIIEKYLNKAARDFREKRGFDPQQDCGHSQNLHGLSWIHWRMAGELLPTLPELDILEDAEEGYYEEEIENEDGTKGKRYVEDETTRLERYRRMQAQAPFPWVAECPRPDTIAATFDRGPDQQLAIVLSVQSVGILSYKDKLRDDDEIILSLNQADKKLLVYEEQDRPENFDASGWDTASWGTLRVATIRTRNEFYELASPEAQGSGYTLIKSGPHKYGMPTYALIPSTLTNHPDPLYRYQPWSLGILRTKPRWDYERSLGALLAEQTAIPKFWIQQADGKFSLDDRGVPREVTRDSAAAETLPPGATLVRADPEVKDAYVKFLGMSKEDLDASIPETGTIDIGISTQPHTAVIAQSQANTGIAYLKMRQAMGLRVMYQNIVDCMGRDCFGESVYFEDDGKVVEITPQMCKGINVDIKIEPNSGAQQFSRNEYLRGLHDDPRNMYPTDEYLQDIGVTDVPARKDAYWQEQAENQVLPAILAQELARKFGDAYVLSPGGGMVSMDGKQAVPMQVLASKGITPGNQIQPAPETLQPMNDTVIPQATAVM